jgi:hypothetical protein
VAALERRDALLDELRNLAEVYPEDHAVRDYATNAVRVIEQR